MANGGILLDETTARQLNAAHQRALLRMQIAAQLLGPLLEIEYNLALGEMAHRSDISGNTDEARKAAAREWQVNIGRPVNAAVHCAELLLQAAGFAEQAGPQHNQAAGESSPLASGNNGKA